MCGHLCYNIVILLFFSGESASNSCFTPGIQQFSMPMTHITFLVANWRYSSDFYIYVCRFSQSFIVESNTTFLVIRSLRFDLMGDIDSSQNVFLFFFFKHPIYGITLTVKVIII